MKFGFLAHPTSVELARHVNLADLIGRLSADLDGGYRSTLWRRGNLTEFLQFGRVRSRTGDECDGVLRYLPMTAEGMRADRSIMNRVRAGVCELAAEGADIVGLGGFTSIVGRRGLDTLSQAPVPVTSGNSLTAYAALRAVEYLTERLGLEPRQTRIAVIGYPGSIGLVVARLLLRAGFCVDLVRRGGGCAPKTKLGADFDAERVTVTSDIGDCYQRNWMYVAASSSGDVIDAAKLLPGSVVVDIALPRDLMQSGQDREDVLAVDGGYVSASADVQVGSQAMGLSMRQCLNGCMAETLLLALEGRAESFSIGRLLDPDKVREIGQIAERHGFMPLPLFSHGRRLEDADIAAIRDHHRAEPASWRYPRAGRDQGELLSRFGRFINPVMADFLSYQRIERTFQSAKGAVLTDHEGRQYLDLVTGYGCLNLGHNPDAVTTALQGFLNDDQPNFVQYISVPAQATLLAQRLSKLAPGGPWRCFFSNSGAEAVEAAIKLARASTGRQKLVYAANSYHGKTLGALSVTGREKHRRNMGELVPGGREVPFGDLKTLELALEDGAAAAFIVEPIQGEGGVHLPPDGYLRGAQELCRCTGTALIVDEVQTGLGRTGRMFASEWAGIEPDILCLAKSLSGGLVPIGATLSRPALWDAAYGTASRFTQHTSTFGGGNFAASAALATLDQLATTDVIAEAASVGEHLRAGLQAVAEEFEFVDAVRGKGMMIAVQLRYPFSGGLATCAREFACRMPGDILRTYRLLPDEAHYHLEEAVHHIEAALEESFCLRFVTKLHNDHGVLTFMTANSNTVLRIQPPLVLTRVQADFVIDAFRRTCLDMSAAAREMQEPA